VLNSYSQRTFCEPADRFFLEPSSLKIAIG
jgi:hypothetical protein